MNHFRERKQNCKVKKYQQHHSAFVVIFCVVLGVLVLGTLFGVHQLICGKSTIIQGSGTYRKLDDKGIYSPLAVFPSSDIDTVSQDFFYQLNDEIFAATCQIYLENRYTEKQFEAEIERLRNLELSYQSQTNCLYVDELNYCNTAYVALANWTDRFEYAIVFENCKTIIYVYLQNMDEKDIYMNKLFLPTYFQDNNVGGYTDEFMDEIHRSFYAFQIGNKYIDCMDLVKQNDAVSNKYPSETNPVAESDYNPDVSEVTKKEEISQEDVSKEITEDDILWLQGKPNWDRMTATHYVMLYPAEPEKDYIFRIYEEDITDERHWSRERDEIAAIMEQSKSVYECPPAREGNIAIGEINAMHYFSYDDYTNDGYTDYFLIVSYLLEEEIVYDCRVYKSTAGGPILEREVTDLLNEKYSHSEDPPAIQMELEIMELLRQE